MEFSLICFNVWMNLSVLISRKKHFFPSRKQTTIHYDAAHCYWAITLSIRRFPSFVIVSLFLNVMLFLSFLSSLSPFHKPFHSLIMEFPNFTFCLKFQKCILPFYGKLVALFEKLSSLHPKK